MSTDHQVTPAREMRPGGHSSRRNVSAICLWMIGSRKTGAVSLKAAARPLAISHRKRCAVLPFGPGELVQLQPQMADRAIDQRQFLRAQHLAAQHEQALEQTDQHRRLAWAQVERHHAAEILAALHASHRMTRSAASAPSTAPTKYSTGNSPDRRERIRPSCSVCSGITTYPQFATIEPWQRIQGIAPCVRHTNQPPGQRIEAQHEHEGIDHTPHLISPQTICEKFCLYFCAGCATLPLPRPTVGSRGRDAADDGECR